MFAAWKRLLKTGSMRKRESERESESERERERERGSVGASEQARESRSTVQLLAELLRESILC